MSQFHSYDAPGNHTELVARGMAWLPAVALVILAHFGVWFTYTRWQSAQAMPLPLPSVQISLVSALVPQETKPTPQIQRAPAAPKPPATMSATPATPQVATNTTAEESAPAAESIESTPSVVPDEITQPLYNAAYLNNPPPAYPLAARRRGLEGTVVVRAQILEDGKCHQANLSKSSGHEMLDQAALAAVRSWHFVPAKRGTQTISAWVEVPITFRLTTQNEQIQSL